MSNQITPERINSLRAVVTWCGRGVAVILVAVGTYLMLKRLAFGAGVLDFRTALQTWMEIGEGQSFYRGVAMVLTGTAMGLLSRRIAAWVIAMPPTGCPQCGYDVAPPTGAAPPSRCPECGLNLGAQSDAR